MGRKLIFVIILGAFLATLGYVSVKFFFNSPEANKTSALRITSFPQSEVFLDFQSVGHTPFYKSPFAPGEYQIKLVPTSAQGTFRPWEGKVTLYDGSETYINQDLASSADKSSGQILWLVALADANAVQLAVVSDPGAANISIDDLGSGQTPLIVQSLTPGNHDITISANGYSDQIIHGNLVRGYRLNAIVKLGRSNSSSFATSSAVPTAALISSPSAEIPAKPYVSVGQTELGFVRVRSQPSLSSAEIGQVKTGEKYHLLDETDNWLKIAWASSSGWISDDYAQIVR